MNEQKLEKIDKNKLPLIYKLILKVPGSDFIQSISSGIFWSIVVPIFLLLDFFINFFLLLLFPFPINILLTLIIPAAVLMVFLRINLERFINWWNLNIEDSFKWDVEKSLKEYLTILKEKEKR
jgi:hypothetical protein